MKPRKLLKEAERIASSYCITDGKKFRLKDFDPADTNGMKSKDAAQGMLAAGKDGAIKHVMSGVNPEGCDVHSFKAPTSDELDHDFLWREHKVMPSRGKIGIFNRSYYEEVLVVRVHPQLLKWEKL